MKAARHSVSTFLFNKLSQYLFEQVDFQLIPCSITDEKNEYHEYLRTWGNERNRADTKTQVLSNYSVLSEGRVMYDLYKE